MAEFVFTSPGIKYRERDLTYVTRNLGITQVGLVGETLKGPAFEPVAVQDKTQFLQRFGAQSTDRFSNGLLQYQLPYVANTYLSESNQLYVTRVLGLSGYDAGKAWAITLSAGLNPDTVVDVSSTTTSPNPTFINNTYLGVTLNSNGDTGTYASGYTKISNNHFEQYEYSFTATTVNQDGTGTIHQVITHSTGTSYTQYENMVLAVVRSRGYVRDNVNIAPTTIFNTSTLTVTGNNTNTGSGDLFGSFVLRAVNSASTETYNVSLNPNASNFISNVIGNKPKDKNTKIWVQSVYPDLIKKLDSDGIGYGVNTTLIDCNSDNFTNYKTEYKTPETPWVVSQLKGTNVDKLFKFISISDGGAANQEIKISIANIKPDTLEFDVIIRDFNDTDANPNILETFSKCTMVKGQTSYIAQRIGTTDGEYVLQSKYVMVEIGDEFTPDDFPAGFEGYYLNDYAISATSTTSSTAGVIPKIFYKTSYNDDDVRKKVYLGVSEHGYDGDNVTGNGINQNLFNYSGQGGFIKSKGFHMDSGATGTYDGYTFDTGAGKFQTVEDIVDSNNPYFDTVTRKFTFAPAGGFDGWDVNRTERTYGDLYRLNGIYDGVDPNGNPKNDFQAWEKGINTFSNPENVTINIFATPGINWSSQNVLVKEAIEMIETQRTDSLYVVDSPDVNISTAIGDNGKADVLATNDIVDLLNVADIDSNYACTYFPWIQIKDSQNNVNIYIPPTSEAIKSMAYTDNVKFPWYAPAGLNRGVTGAIKSKYKLSLEARDILYAGRINPIADFADTGTAIFGQKTLQVKDSMLNRINVRRLLLRIKVLISNIAIRLIFEQNDQTTIDQFKSKVNPILDTIKRERGLKDFQIKMDDSNNTPESIDRGELYGELFLKPVSALEFLGLTFTITPSGASFSDTGA